MDSLRDIVRNLIYKKGQPKIDQIYDQIKPILINQINQTMDSLIGYQTRHRTKVSNFVEAFYNMLDEGGKSKNIKKKFGLSSASYYNYLAFCNNHRIFEIYHTLLIKEFSCYRNSY